MTAIALSVVLGACRYQPTPVQLQGAMGDLDALAGYWVGEYSSTQTGRAGSITFRVIAGSDTAFGDVTMIPDAGQPLTAADVESRTHALHSMHPDVLRITFVRVSGGLVQGALEPYIAPDCQCAVSTVFRGAVNDAGKRIDGEYVTQGPSGLRQVGRWNVKKTSSGMPEPR